MTPKTILRFSCHDLKLEPFYIGIELMVVVILAGVIKSNTYNNNILNNKSSFGPIYWSHVKPNNYHAFITIGVYAILLNINLPLG